MAANPETPPWFRPVEVATGRPTRTRLDEEAGEIVVEISGLGHGWEEIKRCQHHGAERRPIDR